MNLEEIKSELRKLSELVGDWSEQRPIPPLERDLVLEKLRAIYEALRFGLDPSVIGVPKRVLPAAAVQSEPAAQNRFRRPGRFEEEPDIEVVDLNEVLSLDEVAEPAEPAQHVGQGGFAGAAAASSGFAASAAGPAVPPVPEPEEEGPEVIEFGPKPEPEPAPAPRVVPTSRPQLVPETPVREEPAEVAAPTPVAAEAPVPEPAPIAESLPAAEPAFAANHARVAEPAPVANPTPAPVVPQPEEQPRPETKPQNGEPQSLFGPDEEVVRRRHKQRVIMSLYDSAPKPAEPAASKSAGPGVPKREEPAAPYAPAAHADEPEIVLIDTSLDEPAAPPAEPEEEGPEILLLDDEPVEEPAGRLFASAPASRLVETPAPTPVAPRPAAAPAPAAPAPAAPRPAAAVPSEDPASQVLGEVINHDVRTLGDTIAAPRRTYGAPVADLRQAIGINDKFLMIRDLFGGNSVLFDATITALNAQESLDDCMIYIAEHFAWNPDSESVRLLTELLERKFA